MLCGMKSAYFQTGLPPNVPVTKKFQHSVNTVLLNGTSFFVCHSQHENDFLVYMESLSDFHRHVCASGKCLLKY